jgi:hypothetical protein
MFISKGGDELYRPFWNKDIINAFGYYTNNAFTLATNSNWEAGEQGTYILLGSKDAVSGWGYKTIQLYVSDQYPGLLLDSEGNILLRFIKIN